MAQEEEISVVTSQLDVKVYFYNRPSRQTANALAARDLCNRAFGTKELRVGLSGVGHRVRDAAHHTECGTRLLACSRTMNDPEVTQTISSIYQCIKMKQRR